MTELLPAPATPSRVIQGYTATAILSANRLQNLADSLGEITQQEVGPVPAHQFEKLCRQWLNMTLELTLRANGTFQLTAVFPEHEELGKESRHYQQLDLALQRTALPGTFRRSRS